MFDDVFVNLMLMFSIMLLVFAGLIIYIAIKKLEGANQITVPDHFERLFLKKILNLSFNSRRQIESEIDEGKHNGSK